MNPVLQILFLVAAVNGRESPLVARESAESNDGSIIGISKRGVSPYALEALRNLTENFIQDIQEGMSAATINATVGNIRVLAVAILEGNGTAVDGDEVLNIIKEAGAKLIDEDCGAPNATLDERFECKRRALGNAVELLLNLMDRLNRQIENGKPIDETIAAIIKALDRILKAVDCLVDAVAELFGLDPEHVRRDCDIYVKIVAYPGGLYIRVTIVC